ncbi:hypothetical protein ACE6H2_016407 [Prunus campanulata]
MHLVGEDSKKIGGMRNLQDILLKSPTDWLKDLNLPCKEVGSLTGLPAEKERAIDIPPRSSSRLHQSRDDDKTRRTSPPPKHCDSSAKPRAVKHGADLASLNPLEVRMAATKKGRESSTRVNGSSETQTASPKVHKSNSAGDAG